MNLCYGKRPARKGAVKMAFGDYFVPIDLPPVPRVFGNHALIPDWGMLGNDAYADCVFAGAAHETMLWLAQAAGAPSQFTTASVIADYAAVTGFDPTKPDTDQGTDMQAAASYRLKVGIQDAGGGRHKVDAYVALAPGNADQVALAAFLSGAVGVGLRMPASAESQFDAGEPWDIVPGSPIVGGHYVVLVGRNSAGNLLVVTWGRLHAMTPAFLAAYMDEGIAYLSLERLTKNISPEGFDLAALRCDFSQLTSKKGSIQVSDPAKPAIEGAKVDPDMIAAVVAAIKPVVDTFTYDGVRVGSYVTNDELNKVAVAAVAAVLGYQGGQAI